MKFSHVVLLMMLILKTHVKAPKPHERKCHQCRSDKNADCSEIKDDRYLKFCDKNSTARDININSKVCVETYDYSCRKIVQTLYFLDTKKTIVLRECTSVVNKQRLSCYHVYSPSFFYSITCECNEDGCNRSPNARTISWPVLFLLFLRVLFPP